MLMSRPRHTIPLPSDQTSSGIGGVNEVEPVSHDRWVALCLSWTALVRRIPGHVRHQFK